MMDRAAPHRRNSTLASGANTGDCSCCNMAEEGHGGRAEHHHLHTIDCSGRDSRPPNAESVYYYVGGESRLRDHLLPSYSSR